MTLEDKKPGELMALRASLPAATPSIIIFTFLTNVAFLHVSSSDTQGWGVSPRGAGYLFGSDVVTQVQ